ncbi:type II toxin-antitoxin system RelE/ParE family toxin [Rhizobium sp. FKL33]|uniref:type II toxin-antitoxin system RelE/ParE family toxin n=1 Tax=Rhizobium sp. FKL33 TaxID=2562307 RepID=UPI0010BFE5FF|nr:type II toxin-antitoxin system RelE/ParE family toxin [Rhizobium sp. FKL33]
MGYTLRPQAERDIIEAVKYIADHNPVAARRLRIDLLETMRRLGDMPMLGRHRDGTAEDLRSFPEGSYLIFYRVVKDGVAIIRVLHAARDWSNAMREPRY